MRYQFLWALIKNGCYIILPEWLFVLSCFKFTTERKSRFQGMAQNLFWYFIWISFVVYIFILFYVTILSREPFSERRAELSFLWEYRLALRGNVRWMLQIFNNIILFIPMGILYVEMVRRCRWWKALILGAVVSALIEGMQFVCRMGLCETDDVFNNTIGMMIGYFLWRFLQSKIRQHCLKSVLR